MPIEKLYVINHDRESPSIQKITITINELIDFINTREQDISEQMARIITLETELAKHISYVNDIVSALKNEFNAKSDFHRENWRALIDRICSLEKAMQPKEEELLVCPWCDEVPFITFGQSILLSKPPKINWMIRCQNTKCVINPMLNQPFYSKQEAIEAWNSRK